MLQNKDIIHKNPKEKGSNFHQSIPNQVATSPDSWILFLS